MGLKKLLLIAGFSFLAFPAISQTTLSVGDIAIVGVDGQASNDEITFAFLVDIEAGTEFYFTDVDPDGSFTLPSPSGPNGIMRYTAPSDLAKGTVVRYFDAFSQRPAEFDSIDGNFQFGGSGDNILVYQGTSGTAITTYLHAITKTGISDSYPGGFTAIVNFGTDEHGEYRGRRNSTQADLNDSINDVSQWFTSTAAIDPLDITDFRIGYYWDGAAWIPSNPGSVGSAFDDDVIVAGTGATFSGNTQTNNNVYIDAGATLDVGANTLTADSVFIMADATGQGQVKGSVTGDVEFQSYLTSTVARWFNVGSPVNGAISKFSFTNGGQIRTEADGPTANVNIYWYDPTTPTDVDPGPGVDNEGTWTPAANQTLLANSNGWSVYLGGGSVFGTLPMTISSYGSLNSGSVNTTISTSNKGWNFVNNPYAGTIDLDEVDNDNPTLNNVYYIRDAENGAWESWDALNNTGTIQYAAAGQAFFVQTTSPTTLAFQEDQIIMTQDPGILRGQMMELVMLKVYTTDMFADHTVVTLKSGAMDTKNPIIDGVKRINDGTKVPSIYSSIQGVDYVSKYIDDQFTSKSIPVYLEHSIDDELTISADLLTMNKSINVTLEDKLSGDMIDLRKGNYTFRHVSANSPDRFVLHLSQSSVGTGENALAADAIFAYSKGESVFVNLENVSGEVTVELYDLGGKLILNEVVEAGQVVEFTSPNNAGGVYILKVQTDGQILHTQKIMK